MYYRVFTILLSITSISLGVCAQRQVTLDECLKEMHTYRQTSRRAELISSAEQAELANALHYYLPQIELSGRASWQNEVPEIPLFSELMPKNPVASSSTLTPIRDLLSSMQMPQIPKDQYRIALQVGQVIWDGGKIASGRDKIRAESNVARAQILVDERQTEERVRDVYFGILLIDGQLELQRTLIEELERQVDRVQTYINNGLASLNDKDEVRVELIKAHQKLDELTLDRQSLIKVMGIYTGMELSDQNIFEYPRLLPVASDSIVYRPELELIQAQRDVIMADWHRDRSEMIPTLSLFAQGGYARPGLNIFDPDFRPFFIGGVQMTWNIGKLYNLWTTKKSRDAKRIQVNLKYDLVKQDLQAQIEHDQAVLNKLKASQDRDEEIIKVREDIKKRADIQVANGTLSINELMQRITALQVAKQTAVLHRLQLLKQQYQLRSNLGIK